MFCFLSFFAISLTKAAENLTINLVSSDVDDDEVPQKLKDAVKKLDLQNNSINYPITKKNTTSFFANNTENCVHLEKNNNTTKEEKLENNDTLNSTKNRNNDIKIKSNEDIKEYASESKDNVITNEELHTSEDKISENSMMASTAISDPQTEDTIEDNYENPTTEISISQENIELTDQSTQPKTEDDSGNEDSEGDFWQKYESSDRENDTEPSRSGNVISNMSYYIHPNITNKLRQQFFDKGNADETDGDNEHDNNDHLEDQPQSQYITLPQYYIDRRTGNQYPFPQTEEELQMLPPDHQRVVLRILNRLQAEYNARAENEEYNRRLREQQYQWYQQQQQLKQQQQYNQQYNNQYNQRYNQQYNNQFNQQQQQQYNNQYNQKYNNHQKQNHNEEKSFPPNTELDGEGRLSCIDGYIGDSPVGKRGCWRCKANCHVRADCFHPGYCQCVGGYVGDGVSKCSAPIPYIVSASGRAEICVRYVGVSPEFVARSAFCSMEGVKVPAVRVTNESVICQPPAKRPKNISISFDGESWSDPRLVAALSPVTTSKINIIAYIVAVIALVIGVVQMLIGIKKPVVDDTAPLMRDDLPNVHYESSAY